MKIKRLILLLFMTTLANFIFASSPVVGPVNDDGVYGVETPLDIYSIYSPSDDTLFMLSTGNQGIDYSQSTVQYETENYDLSLSGNTEDFSLDVFSNFDTYSYYYDVTRNYDLEIYFSSYFVPVDDTIAASNNYPYVPIFLNANISSQTFNISVWGFETYYNYITFDQSYNTYITYGNKTAYAQSYKYSIQVPPGLHYLNLMNFNFSWTGNTTQLDQYMDMEGYVRIVISSV